MRPNLQYVQEKFDFYNKLCFDGLLPRPLIRLNTRYAAMGITKSLSYTDADGKRHTDISIEISIRQDLPESEYIDTILHEMIHYYILINNIVDDSPHGNVFKSKIKELSDNHGLKVSLAFEPTDEMLVKSVSHPRYVCVVDFIDGRTAFAVVAKNKLFQFWDIYSTIYKNVKSVDWFVSNRAIFGEFPVAVTPSLIGIEADKLHHYLSGAIHLRRVNGTILIDRK